MASERFAKLLVLAAALMGGTGIGTGLMSQMSLQYSAMVLSLLKKPDLAIPVIAILVHFL